jgi:hypothetical protein
MQAQACPDRGVERGLDHRAHLAHHSCVDRPAVLQIRDAAQGDIVGRADRSAGERREYVQLGEAGAREGDGIRTHVEDAVMIESGEAGGAAERNIVGIDIDRARIAGGRSS